MSDQQTGTQTVRATAEIATPQARLYLTQLCKHFQHKCPVELDEAAGRIIFSAGDCDLQAQDGILRLSVTAEDGTQLALLQDVVARHLLRFAFREELRITWHSA
jgi:uncharacterized protein